MNNLYILEINSLSLVSFAIIFPHSEGCLFAMFLVSFAVQKLLIRSHLFLFPLFKEVGHRGSCCDLYQKSVLPMFSSNSFIGSAFIFNSLTYFDFIFV